MQEIIMIEIQKFNILAIGNGIYIQETPKFNVFAIGNGLYVQETPKLAKIYNTLINRLKDSIQLDLITKVMILRC